MASAALLSPAPRGRHTNHPPLHSLKGRPALPNDPTPLQPETIVTTAARGHRRRCTSCSAPFYDLQRDPISYFRRVEGGEAFLILRDDRPVAEIRPVPANAREPRPFGLCAGQFTVPDDFDRPLPDEILKEFEGP